MTTKEQELKALAQIKKIVDGLGENSYIAAAFEGCFEIAEDNIGNDFACSMKQRAESAGKEAENLKKENCELRDMLNEQREKVEKLTQECGEARKELHMKRLPDWMRRELNKMIQTGIKRVKDEIRETSDGMAAAIGEDGRMATQAAGLAKRYREKRVEQEMLNRMQSFILNNYEANEQE